MKHTKTGFLSLILALVLTLSACGGPNPSEQASIFPENSQSVVSTLPLPSNQTGGQAPDEKPSPDTSWPGQSSVPIDLADIPPYCGELFVTVNGNLPGFPEGELTTTSFESYSSLDSLGRCGVAYACLGPDLMPTEERGNISEVKPTGWHSGSPANYNRSHLIGFQLAGENANELNLITGTREFNAEGMLPFENMVADYIHETDNHVMYRVTPIYQGDELVARGVQMEAYSVEDDGDGICYNVYVYNNQSGVTIDYATGEAWLSEESPVQEGPSQSQNGNRPSEPKDYILNTNTMKFHEPTCSSVDDMTEKNKETYSGSRDDIISKGYSPCGRCKP